VLSQRLKAFVVVAVVLLIPFGAAAQAQQAPPDVPLNPLAPSNLAKTRPKPVVRTRGGSARRRP
jgi:hypothetical protein